MERYLWVIMNIVAISALFMIKVSQSAVIDNVSDGGSDDTVCQLQGVILRNEETILDMIQQQATLQVTDTNYIHIYTLKKTVNSDQLVSINNAGYTLQNECSISKNITDSYYVHRNPTYNYCHDTQ